MPGSGNPGGADSPSRASTGPAEPALDADGQLAPAVSRTSHRAGKGGSRNHSAYAAASVNELLPAARSIQEGSQNDGRPLKRDTLAAGLRAAGYRVGNDRLTPVLAALRDTPPFDDL